MRKRLVLGALLIPVWLEAQQTRFMTDPGFEPLLVGMNHPEGQSGPVLGKPFSATEVRHSKQVLADGTNVDRTDTSLFYRDERGRMRTGNDTTAVIFDPVAGFTYTLNLRSKTYQKVPIRQGNDKYSIAVIENRTSTTTTSSSSSWGGDSKGAISQGRRALESKPVTQELPAQWIAGVLATGSRSTTTIPMGALGNDRDVAIVNERWQSNDLQVVLRTMNSDPRFGVTTYELTNLVQGPQDAAMFVVSPDYFLQAPVFSFHGRHEQ